MTDACCYCSIGDEHPDPNTPCWPTQETPMTRQPTDWTDEEFIATFGTPGNTTDEQYRNLIRATNAKLDTLTRDQLRDQKFTTAADLADILDEWLHTEHGVFSGRHNAGHFLNLLYDRGYYLAAVDED